MQAEPNPSQLDKAECERHLRGLNSYKRKIREASLRQVSRLPPEHLLQLMQEGARLYRKRYSLSSCVEVLLLIVWLPVGLNLFLQTNGSASLFGWSLLLVAICAIGWHICTVPWRMYRALVGVLEHTDDLKLLGPAISMYVRPDGPARTRIILGKTLCRLLPQLHTSHAALLTADQKQDFFRMLFMGASSENAEEKSLSVRVTLQALKALEQIGDESAIPTVKNLITSPANQDKMVRQSAEQCLEFLELNRGRHREMQTLLRASSVANTAPDMLLRPASGSDNTASEQLLRPQL